MLTANGEGTTLGSAFTAVYGPARVLNASFDIYLESIIFVLLLLAFGVSRFIFKCEVFSFFAACGVLYCYLSALVFMFSSLLFSLLMSLVVFGYAGAAAACDV